MLKGSDTDIEQFRVVNAQPTAYYVSEFITSEEEQSILTKIYATPKPKWTQLTNRRLQNWGGIPHHKGMIAETIPSWLEQYLDKIHRLDLMGGKKPNHILVNEYLPGQGIMPHLDGDLFYPTITTVSLGSHTVLRFTEPTDQKIIEYKPVISFLLEPRSLLVLQDQLFSNYLHCIEEVESDFIDDGILNLNMCTNKYVKDTYVKRGTRLSLTIRHVPKTTSFKIFGNKNVYKYPSSKIDPITVFKTTFQHSNNILLVYYNAGFGRIYWSTGSCYAPAMSLQNANKSNYFLAPVFGSTKSSFNCLVEDYYWYQYSCCYLLLVRFKCNYIINVLLVYFVFSYL